MFILYFQPDVLLRYHLPTFTILSKLLLILGLLLELQLPSNYHLDRFSVAHRLADSPTSSGLHLDTSSPIPATWGQLLLQPHPSRRQMVRSQSQMWSANLHQPGKCAFSQGRRTEFQQTSGRVQFAFSGVRAPATIRMSSCSLPLDLQPKTNIVENGQSRSHASVSPK